MITGDFETVCNCVKCVCNVYVSGTFYIVCNKKTEAFERDRDANLETDWNTKGRKKDVQPSIYLLTQIWREILTQPAGQDIETSNSWVAQKKTEGKWFTRQVLHFNNQSSLKISYIF